MKARFAAFFLVMMSLAMPVALSAQPEGLWEAPVEVELVAREQWMEPGQALQVAVCLKMDEGWHSYWKNPGEAGIPTAITWDLPVGFDAGEARWPAPQKFDDGMGVAYGYEGSVCFFTEITPSAELTAGDEVLIKASVEWMACNDSCIPGTTDVELTMMVHDSPATMNKAWSGHIAALADRVPEWNPEVEIRKEEGQWIITFEEDEEIDFDQAYFFSEEQGVIDLAALQTLDRNGESYELVLTTEGPSDDLDELRGVLVLGSDGTSHAEGSKVPLTAWEVAMPLSDSLVDASIGGAVAFEGETGAGSDLTFGLAVLLSLVGGLILNLMPCVLPVISFKVMSFVKMAGESRRMVWNHSLAFFFGVILSFWVLSGALLLLRSYGELVGWGFQLQNPLFVALLAFALAIFALSLFGVFELGASVSSWAGSQQKMSTSDNGTWSALSGSFFSGVLATAVATPCTGPFLGTTLGFAVTLPTWKAMTIFTAMGVGMAFPYLIFGIFPSLLRFMPKPGAWMVVFKELMGFVIAATVLWLVWVFGALTSAAAVAWLLGAFLVASVGCWIYGKWGTPATKRLPRRLATGVALGICLVAAWQVVDASRMAPEAGSENPSSDAWMAFSQSKLEALKGSGQPVFIDFTAKWCLICQANKAVLHSTVVESAFDQMGVVRMEADWTRSDPEITQELRKFGRSGVPLYVLYDGVPGHEPVVFPQVLTPDVVVEAVNQIGG